MKLSQYAWGLCLVTLVACGAEDSPEDWANAEAELSGPRLLASDTDGNLYAGIGTTFFTRLETFPGTKAAAVEGTTQTSGHFPRFSYYVSTDGRAFERLRDGSFRQTRVSENAASSELIDITSSSTESFAVSAAGRILKRSSAGVFEDPDSLQVRIDVQTQTIPVSRIDVCDDGTALAVAQDGTQLFRLPRSGSRWSSVSLEELPGRPQSTAHVLDVGCGTGQAFIVASRGTPYAVYQQTGTNWKRRAAGGPMFVASRVDVDSNGRVWFVANDAQRGTNLWRVNSDGSNLVAADLPNAFDVGS